MKKVIVFDLDETIGHFEEFGRFIDGLAALHEGDVFAKTYKHDAFDSITQKHFKGLLDLYPEFFRPRIFSVFKNLIKQKKKDKNLQIVIYTNNMGPRSWTLYIKKYIEDKIKYKLFDKIITGYRPGEKGNCRTTHNKTRKDLIKCNHLDNNALILFFDDQYHPHMHHKNIDYIHLYPYRLNIPFVEMSLRFLKANKRGRFGKNFEFTDKITQTDFINTISEILGKLGRKHVSYKVIKTQQSEKDYKETDRIKKSINKFIKKNITRRKNKKLRANKTHKIKRVK